MMNDGSMNCLSREKRTFVIAIDTDESTMMPVAFDDGSRSDDCGCGGRRRKPNRGS